LSIKVFAPAYLTKGQLLAVLDEVRQLVAENDSFEGSLSYELPWSTELGDPVDDSRSGFRVRASYRTGNSMGQGGMRMIGEWVDEPTGG
jgi:quinol monooxygenase YgiN